ncbi:MAG: DUF1934 domain-containing protein [Clostridia bacterium]|nr:DUF1934 domain-containing protein [Clostridia bacterium]
MERDATIIIKEHKDGEISLVTTGKVLRIGKSINVFYNQENASYAVGVSEGIVTIKRESDEDYTLVLQEGVESKLSVQTPFGVLSFKVFPKKVYFEERENGIFVELLYYISGGTGAPEKFSLILECRYEK